MLNTLSRNAGLILVALVALAGAPALAQIETAAREAFMIDYDTGAVLLEKNADELMPPSSMSKLMTAFMVFERLQAGTLKLDDEFGVSEKAWRMSLTEGSNMFVALGDRIKVEDLLRGMIVQSGNDACIVLAEGLATSEERFAEMMTQRARELGMTKSVFKNASGWPHPEHVMTARELAIVAREIISRFPEYYKYYSEKDFTWGVDRATKKPIKQGNRNPLLYKDVGADGLKTGHTAAAGYGLTASAKRGDRRLILVVNGLKSMNERSRESERLLDIGFREFDNAKLFTAGATVDEADVWLGAAAKVPLVVEKNLMFTLPRKNRPGLKVTAVYDSPIPAPIRKGTPVARLVVTAPEMAPVEVPLVAGADVERLGFGGRIAAAAGHLIWGPPRK